MFFSWFDVHWMFALIKVRVHLGCNLIFNDSFCQVVHNNVILFLIGDIFSSVLVHQSCQSSVPFEIDCCRQIGSIAADLEIGRYRSVSVEDRRMSVEDRSMSYNFQRGNLQLIFYHIHSIDFSIHIICICVSCNNTFMQRCFLSIHMSYVHSPRMLAYEN